MHFGCGRVQLNCDGVRWRTEGSEGETGERSGHHFQRLLWLHSNVPNFPSLASPRDVTFQLDSTVAQDHSDFPNALYNPKLCSVASSKLSVENKTKCPSCGFSLYSTTNITRNTVIDSLNNTTYIVNQYYYLELGDVFLFTEPSSGQFSKHSTSIFSECAHQ